MNRLLINAILTFFLTPYIAGTEHSLPLTLAQKKERFLLNKQLFANNLTPDKIDDLLRKGANINYVDHKTYQTPLSYWLCPSRKDNHQAIILAKDLLQKGANIDRNLASAMHNENMEQVQILLPYASDKEWNSAVSFYPECIDLLIEHSTTQQDLNEGLVACVTTKYYQTEKHIEYMPEIMEKFITKGANPTLALNALVVELDTIPVPTKINDNFCKNFLFLCNKHVFDHNTLALIKNKFAILDTLFSVLKANDPLRPQQTDKG